MDEAKVIAQGRGRGGSHARLGLSDVPGAEQELAVEVGDVDRVHVDLRFFFCLFQKKKGVGVEGLRKREIDGVAKKKWFVANF